MIRTQTLVVLSMGFALVSHAKAQWSDDASMHMVVADGAGEQVQPKVVATPDGGCYVSWFTSISGYDVRLQRLDASGNEMWAHNGILIADRGYSSTQDYGLDVDANGNALIAFRDDRFAGEFVTAQCIAPDGTAQWGPDGVQLANGTDFIASPVIAGNSDGDAVVGWINENDSHFTMVSNAGVVGWTTMINDPGGEIVNVADLQTSDNGSVIASWVQRGSQFFNPKHLAAQKLNADGTEAWASRVMVFDNGSLQFGNFPDFVADGAGGAVFAWYDTANSLQVYAQHLASDGTEQFAHNGVAVSTNARERVSPTAGYDAASDSVLVAWTELDNNQGSQGVFAQRLNNTGARMWTDSGVELSAIDPNESGSVQVQIAGGAMVTMWIENSGVFAADRVRAAAREMDSTDPWSGTLDVTSDVAQRARLATTLSSDGFIISAWQIGDFGDADIETHNINPDGTLGAIACAADITGEGVLDIFDVFGFVEAFNALDPIADFTDDQIFDIFDVFAFVEAFNLGC